MKQRRRLLPALATLTFVLALPPALFGDALAQGQPQGGAQDAAGAKTPVKASDAKKSILKSRDYYIKKDPSVYEQAAREKRSQEIELYKVILENPDIDADQKAEATLRLAESYWETAKDLYLTEMSQHLERYDAWFNSTDPKKGPEPVEDHAKSQTYNRLATDLYRQFLKDYPNYRALDKVYFNLAFNLMDLGEKNEGLEFYQALVKNYPQSEFVPDAYLAIGEHFFENNNAFKALGNYKKASTYADSRVQVFALYKLGWCYYNVGEYDKSIETMKEVIAKSNLLPADEAGRVSLKDEALNDLVLFFSELGDMEAAYKYFSQFGEKRHYKAMLKRLAGIYFEQGKNDQSITTYRRLITEDPTAADAPTFQNEIIGAFFKSGRKEQTIAEIDRLAADYGPESAWAKANSKNGDALKAANELIEKNLRSVAIDYHKEARKTASQKTYQLASQSYQKYLTLFPKNQHSYDVRFAYAEVLYELKQYEEAAGQYEKVLEIDPKGKYFQVAASSLILTIDRILGLDKKSAESAGQDAAAQSAAKREAKELKPEPLNAWEERKIRACDQFANNLPEHKDSPGILYEAARLLYDKNQFELAVPRFLSVIDRYGKQEVAEISANLVLDAYNLQKDYAKLDQYARRFYQNANFRVEFKNELKDIFEKASYKKVEGLEQAGKEREAAAGYLAYYTEFPGGVGADKALFNAAFYYFKAGDVKQSLELREKFVTTFPKSELQPRNLDELGKLFEAMADYRKAADYYEKLAALDAPRKYEGTADALFNAGLFRESLGELDRAIANYSAYAKDFPNREDAHLTQLEVGRLYEASKKLLEAGTLYKRLFTEPGFTAKGPELLFEARLRYGKLLRAQNQYALAQTHFQESAALYDRLSKSGAELGLAPLFMAEMRFYLVEPLFEQFKAIKLTLPKKGQKESPLDAKLKLKDKVVAAYTAVLELRQGEWGIAAIFQIGETYRLLAEALLSAPIPPELNEDQRKIYLARLQDSVFPIQDSAAEAFEQAMTTSYELGLYNEYTSRAATLLAALKPKEFPALAERLDTPEHLSDSPETFALMKQPEKLEQAMRERLMTDPKNIGAYRSLARLYYAKANYRLSQLLAANAVKLNPQDAGAHNNLGVTLLKLGLERPAILSFKKAIEIEPTHVEANLNLGAIALKSGDYNLARTSYESVLTKDSRNVTAHLGLAVALRGQQELEGALAEYEKVLSQAPDNYTALYNLGIVHEKYVHDFDKALQYFQRCATLPEGSAEANAIQKKMDEVRAGKEAWLEARRQEEARQAAERAEAERLAAEKARQEKAITEARANLEALIARAGKLVQDGQGKHPKQKLESVQMAIDQARELLKQDDLDMILEVYKYLENEARVLQP